MTRRRPAACWRNEEAGLVIRYRSLAGAVLLAASLGGCETPEQTLAGEQAIATQVALRRAQFEMACPTATASILSSQLLQPVAWRGLERAEYTIGVSGCGRRETYISICQLGSPSCLAISPRVNAPMQ
jgi:hypothetical protein